MQLTSTTLQPFILNEHYNLIVLLDGDYQPELSRFNDEDKVVLEKCVDKLCADRSRPVPTTRMNESCRDRSRPVPTTCMDESRRDRSRPVRMHELNLQLEKNCHLRHPLQIIYCTNNTSDLNSAITLEENSSATIIEHHINLHNQSCNIKKTNQINLHHHSKLDYYLVQQENDHASHVAEITIEQAKQTTCNLYNCLLSGNQYQCTTNINFNDSNCQTNVYGFYRAVQQQNIVYQLLINHHAPQCSANVLFKGTADHQAKVIFNGKIMVDKNAPKSYARLVNKNLLLSQDAIIDTSPELEIYADDVQCSHGATVGQLDENVLFYLRSRGIDYSSARNLLLQAFVNEVIDLMPINVVGTGRDLSITA